ncbi:sigma-70 family RNA polymerase sigma factor [Pedobacter psychrodurus]|uniref:Sigma-70 family RNA polymerase sigma factor n=1 Tax=Pedobacter psychrodurus TaxID=2530456 RepID=A0A4R0PYP7_9SPHI|nr:sigma-70 family RNA polymerase sigma factor [Pedobacter psychrodurus]TCD28252.1 sigma-70 family RNA polymerase sigma factor [Pedobacter psychrodurus]
MFPDNLHDKEELKYLEALKDGHQYAFDFIYTRYSKMLLPKLQRMIKLNEVVDELLQDVFLKVWLNRAEIDLQKSFKGWIFKIAQNTVYGYFRKLALDIKMQRYLLETFAEFYDQTEDYIFNKERVELLNQAIEKLPAQRKEIFRLCRIEGKTYQEAAEILSLSPSTVSNQLVSATKYIKRYVFFHAQEFIVFCIAAYLKG